MAQPKQSKTTLKNVLHTLHRAVNKRILPAALLFILFSICFIPVTSHINRVIREDSYQALQEMTNQTTADLRSEMEEGLRQLQLSAGILSKGSSLDDEHVRIILQEFLKYSKAEQAGFLFPNGRSIETKQGFLPAADSSTFQTELEKVPYAAHVLRRPEDSQKKYICQATPVEQNGTTLGILYSFLSLETLAERYAPVAQSKVDFFVLDGSSGDFLIDTRNDTLGNFYEEDFHNVKFLPRGNNGKKIQADLSNGRSGGMEFQVKETKEAFFLYYAPVRLEDWMIMLTLPQDELFQAAQQIQKIMYQMFFTELGFFLVYLGWIMVRNYRQSAHQEQQLAQMAGQLDIQQTLFGAYQDETCINTALGKAAKILTAEKAFLVSKMSSRETYVWPERDLNRQDTFDVDGLQKDLPRLSEAFLTGQVILLDTRQRALRPRPEERAVLKRQKVVSVMAVPIFNGKREFIGVLGAVNMQQKWNQTGLLEGIAHNFMMALENIHSYRIIEQMGTIDALTDLKNRNSYQRTLVEQDGELTGCVYLDANGLHELNNEFGHAAGDAMLKAVGTGLREMFGPADTYRIGGDEFVVLCRGWDYAETEEHLKRLCALMEEQGYHISVGLAWREAGQTVSALVTAAEEKMYADKQRYYDSLGDPTRQMR